MVDNIRLVHEIALTPSELYEFTLEFTSYMEETGASYQTLRRYRSTFDSFLRWLGDEDFTRELYVRWLTYCEETSKPSTVQSRHSQMNSFFNFLVTENQLCVNPVIGLGTSSRGRRLSENFGAIISEVPHTYYLAAKEAYQSHPSEDALVRWVCIELLYTFGCSPNLMPNLNINLENNTYEIVGIDKCSGLVVDGPTDACQTMAANVYKYPLEFKGTLVRSKDMSNLVVKALCKTRLSSNISEHLSPREFIVNFCGRVLQRGGTVTDLHIRTGHSLVWCYAVAQKYQELQSD